MQKRKKKRIRAREERLDAFLQEHPPLAYKDGKSLKEIRDELWEL